MAAGGAKESVPPQRLRVHAGRPGADPETSERTEPFVFYVKFRGTAGPIDHAGCHLSGDKRDAIRGLLRPEPHDLRPSDTHVQLRWCRDLRHAVPGQHHSAGTTESSIADSAAILWRSEYPGQSTGGE